MAILYSTSNLITALTLLSVTTEDAIYVKENLYCNRPSKPFMFTAKANQAIIIDLGPAPPETSIAGVFGHNLTAAATCRLEGNTINAWPGPYQYPFAVWAYDMYLTFKRTYRYWRLFVDDPGNPYNPRVGEFWLGARAKFTTARVAPGRDDSKTFWADEKQTAYGQDWDAYYSEQKVFRLSLSTITDPAVADELEAFLSAIAGPAGRFVFVPDPARPWVYFVKVSGSPSASRPVYGARELRRWAMEIRELTRGITLL